MASIYHKLVSAIINDTSFEKIKCKRNIKSSLEELVDYNTCINPVKFESGVSPKQAEIMVWMWFLFYSSMPGFSAMKLAVPVIYWLGIQTKPNVFHKIAFVFVCLLNYGIKYPTKNWVEDELVNLVGIIRHDFNIKYDEELVLTKMSRFRNIFINVWNYMVCFLYIF